jgi:hypothetical protein
MHYGAYAFSQIGKKTIEPTVSQLMYLFFISTCLYSGKICGSLLKPRYESKHKILKKKRQSVNSLTVQRIMFILRYQFGVYSS